MASAFEAAVTRAWPIEAWAETHVIAAVSGGADSCALLAALAALKPPGGGELVAAHFNHQLRGTAGDADESFVVELGEKLGLGVVVGRGDVAGAAALAGNGIEAAARAARYEFLLQTAEQCGARYVATAHTADDQVETVLFRILRGTGLAGLAGMRAARPLSEAVTLVRPLLALRRDDVLAYLAERGIGQRNDETNADLRFARNRLRHALLPMLRADFNLEVDAALLRLAQLAGENQRVIDELVAQIYDRAVTAVDEQIIVAARPLQSAQRYVIREMFVRMWQQRRWPQQSMGFAEWDALACMAQSCGEQTRTFPGNIQATKKGEQLMLARLGVSR